MSRSERGSRSCGALLVMMAAASAAWAADLAVVSVVFEPGFDVPARELALATHEAARLLSPAGVRLAPLAPSSAGDASAATGRSVVVRLVACGHPAAPPCRPGALGSTVLEADGIRARYVAIFLDRVRATARACVLARATLLGRVLAHELVHALVGSGAHEETGLMRAAWTHDAIEGPLDARRALTPATRGRLRSALRPVLE